MSEFPLQFMKSWQMLTCGQYQVRRLFQVNRQIFWVLVLVWSWIKYTWNNIKETTSKKFYFHWKNWFLYIKQTFIKSNNKITETESIFWWEYKIILLPTVLTVWTAWNVSKKVVAVVLKSGSMWEKKINKGIRPYQVRAYHPESPRKEAKRVKNVETRMKTDKINTHMHTHTCMHAYTHFTHNRMQSN